MGETPEEDMAPTCRYISLSSMFPCSVSIKTHWPGRIVSRCTPGSSQLDSKVDTRLRLEVPPFEQVNNQVVPATDPRLAHVLVLRAQATDVAVLDRKSSLAPSGWKSFVREQNKTLFPSRRE
jgi:hypothetical protein